MPPSPGGEGPEVVLDLNKEEHVSLYMDSWSASGRYYGLVLQKSGYVTAPSPLDIAAEGCRSDWQTLRTIDTHTMKYVDDDLGFSKFTFGACWIGEHVSSGIR